MSMLPSVMRYRHLHIEHFVKIFAMLGLAFAQLLIAQDISAFEDRKKVQSGETQVIAKIGKREITVSELRVEMGRLGLTDANRQTEQFALQSIINRHLLVSAARQADFHRKPEAALRMKAAQEQALADYYLGTASQPPEPTLAEVEDYIAENPGLFARRTQYTFSVLTMATRDFDAENMTALFSNTKTFEELEKSLAQENITYTITPLAQASSSFPTEIRRQLAQYSITDNIVIKGNDDTKIMKIISEKADTLPTDQWPTISRRIVMEENAVQRAKALVDSLKLGNSIVYYRKDLAPVSVKATPNQTQKKATGK